MGIDDSIWTCRVDDPLGLVNHDQRSKSLSLSSLFIYYGLQCDLPHVCHCRIVSVHRREILTDYRADHAVVML